MNKLVVEPQGWPCTLEECPPGFFVWTNQINGDKTLCCKTEYRENGQIQAYNEGGEFFVGGALDYEKRKLLMVQPVNYYWETD